jgi:site-specific recombinase XerD
MPQQLSLFDETPPEQPARPAAQVTSVPYIPPGPDVSLSAAITAYSDHLDTSRFAPASRSAMKNDLNTLGQILGMNRMVNSLTRRDLEEMIAALEGNSKPTTVARRLYTLNGFLDWLREQGALHSGLRLDVERPEPIKITILTREQEAQLLDSTRANPRADFLVRLILGTGLKRNEVAALRGKHVLLDGESPRIVVESKIKTRSRQVAAPPDLLPIYETYCQHRPDGRPKPEDRVFPVTVRALEYELSSYAESLHIPCDFTTLRWTAAVHFLQQGIDTERLRLKLGLSELSWEETLERLHQLV